MMNNNSTLREFPSEDWLIEKAINSSMSCKCIQTKYGYKERLISALLKKYNIKSTYRQNMKEMLILPLDVERLKELYTVDKLSSIEIAKRLNCSKSTVLKRLKDHNVEMRSSTDSIYYKARKAGPQKTITQGWIYTNFGGKRFHRIVMECKLGRELLSGETVHHINLNKTDNRVKNLFIFESNRQHMLYHGFISTYRYIHPRIYSKYVLSKLKKTILNYDWLYDKYIIENMSMNRISKICFVSRDAVRSSLEGTGILYQKPMCIN